MAMMATHPNRYVRPNRRRAHDDRYISQAFRSTETNDNPFTTVMS